MADHTPEPEDTQAPEDTLSGFDVNVEDAGTWKKKVTVTVPADRIEAKRDEMYGELRETAAVPGFRVGRAPKRLLERRFAKEVAQDVRNSLIGEALGKAIEEQELKTLGEPDLNLDEIELPSEGDMTFSFEVEVAPEFELPELKDIPVEKTKVEVNDERVDELVDRYRQMQASYEDTDEAVGEGDMVVAGVTVTPEGAEEGVHRPGMQLRAAPAQVEGIPVVDLGEKLKDKKAGDTVEFEVEVPEGHPNEEWQGKKANVEIAISQVRRRQVPEANDEWAKTWGFESLKEMRDFLGERLESQVQQDQQNAMLGQVRQYLLDNSDFELPEGVMARHASRVLQRRAVELLRQGVPQEKIQENLAELKAQATEQAKDDLKAQFILARIADERTIEVNEAEINARVAAMAQAYQRRPERLRQELEQDGTLEALAQGIQEEKVLESLLADAKISEVEPSEAAADADAQTESASDEDES